MRSDPTPLWAFDRRRKSRAHSSAGERSLHTGEVQGSIPCAPTRSFNKIRYFRSCDLSAMVDDWQLHAEQSTKWRAVTCKIRAVGCPSVRVKFSFLGPFLFGVRWVLAYVKSQWPKLNFAVAYFGLQFALKLP